MSAGLQRRLRPLAAVNRVQPLVRFTPAYRAIGVRRRVPIPLADMVRRVVLLLAVPGVRTCTYATGSANPAQVRYLRRVLAPEEVFFQTCCCPPAGSTLANDSKRYFDFRGSTGNHPKTLQVADLPRMTPAGRTSPASWTSGWTRRCSTCWTSASSGIKHSR